MIRSAIAVLSLMTLAAPALATEDQEAPATSKKEKMVCKQIANTGWRLASGRVCKKAADWDARNRQQRQDMQDHGSYSGRSRCLGCDE